MQDTFSIKLPLSSIEQDKSKLHKQVRNLLNGNINYFFWSY